VTLSRLVALALGVASLTHTIPALGAQVVDEAAYQRRFFVIGFAGDVGLAVDLSQVRREGDIALIPVIAYADKEFALDSGVVAATRTDLYAVNCATSHVVEFGSRYYNREGRQVRDETLDVPQALPPADAWSPIPASSALATVSSVGCFRDNLRQRTNTHRLLVLGESDDRLFRVAPNEIDVASGDTIILFRSQSRDLGLRYERIAYEDRGDRRTVVHTDAARAAYSGRGPILRWIVPRPVHQDGALIITPASGVPRVVRLSKRTR
jgi:hypothetical protein